MSPTRSCLSSMVHFLSTKCLSVEAGSRIMRSADPKSWGECRSHEVVVGTATLHNIYIYYRHTTRYNGVTSTDGQFNTLHRRRGCARSK
jgi:hypothetical protein